MPPNQYETIFNDGVIVVPDNCNLTSGTKIIFTVIKDEAAELEKWEKRFPPHIDTTKWKFNREEANERR